MKRISRWCAVVSSLCLLLAACGATPVDEIALQTQVAATVYADQTNQAEAFTATPTSTWTPTPTPTETYTPTPTATPTSTPTSTATSTPTPSLTPTSTSTPTASPTALPTATPKPSAKPTNRPRPTKTPTPVAQAPLVITLANMHYEQESDQGGRYFHTSWIIYNRSDKTLQRVWRPKFYYYAGNESLGWAWAGYYDCAYGWPQGSCYHSLEREQPNIGPGQTVEFVWYAITQRPEEWIRYATFDALGWQYAFEFDPAGQLIGQSAEPADS
jgi:hypothetical protein